LSRWYYAVKRFKVGWLVVDKISLYVYLKGIWEVVCNGMPKECWEIVRWYCGTCLFQFAKSDLRHI